MFQDKSKGDVATTQPGVSEGRSELPIHVTPQPRSIISRIDDAQMQKVLALRERLFGHYHIPGSAHSGDRDEFDGELTFHIMLEMNGEPVGVARLQPVSTRGGEILPHLSANFSLFDPRTAYDDPRQVVDMSRVDVVSDAPKGAFEVLVASCLDLSAASGFSTIVAFTPRGIGGYMTSLGVPYEVLSGERCHVSQTAATPTTPAQTIELIITSFETSHEVAEKFLAHVGASIRPK